MKPKSPVALEDARLEKKYLGMPDKMKKLVGGGTKQLGGEYRKLIKLLGKRIRKIEKEERKTTLRLTDKHGLDPDYVSEIAWKISRLEGTDFATFLKTEEDIVVEAINIANQNRILKLTPLDIYVAAKDLVQDEEHPAEFILEAYRHHRDELLKRAVKIRRERDNVR